MRLNSKIGKSFISVVLCLSMVTSMFWMSIGSAYALITEDSISYRFTGRDANTAGYAEGTVTLVSAKGGTYYLYWADKNKKPLDGYYEITSMTLSENETVDFEFGYHTAIPADAEKIIAVKSESPSEVCAVYNLPDEKKLPYSSNETLYTFNSYSDIHIDQDKYYENAEENWASALEFAANKNTDFIVSAGDSITNASSPKREWDIYEKILANSGYLNPIYESNGNHDLRTGASSGTKAFVKGSGTDNTIANYNANKPYYSVTEKTTGDLFIFMALEYVYNPSSGEEFSDKQLAWVENLLEENYGKGINIYIIEHSHIQGYGAGDNTANPYYKAGLSTQHMSTVKFKSLLQKYRDIIWMSGHTHEDYDMGYNYSNENGTACNMIHNSAVAGPTHPSTESHSLDYTFYKGLSQGYYVAVYDDSVIFYGANVCDEKIYPAYSYIMNGSRQSDEDSTNPTDPVETTPPTAATGSTLGDDTETTTYYFVNSLKWQFVDCYAWSDSDQSACIWPGYGCTYFATDEYGNDIYYVKVPSSLDKIIFNNAGNDKQTVDIELDGINNCFTPDGTTTSGNYNVKSSIWDGFIPTDPIVTDPTENPYPTEESTLPATDPTEESTSQSTETTQPQPIDIGDVNGDANITVVDATYIQRYLANLISFSETQKIAADVNGDDNITITDATCIQKYIAGLIDKFPALKKTVEVNIAKIINSLAAVQTYSIDTSLDNAKEALSYYYQFSSYDQYQAVKKLYYNYLSLDNPSEETKNSISAELEMAINDLKTIADYIMAKDFDKGYNKDLVLYFAAPDEWLNLKYTVKTNVCFDSADNSWGQHNMIQTTDKYNGLTVFRYTYSSMDFVSDSIDTLQFQAYEGSSWKTQFVAKSSKTSCDSINGMLYDSKTGKWVIYTPSEGTKDVVNTGYALNYHSNFHKWDSFDTFFIKQANGIYTLDFTVPANEGNISCNVYKFSDRTYNCVADSTSYDIIVSTADSATFNLSPSSSRGKSLTIYGAPQGSVLSFVYDSNANTLTISYDLTGETPAPKKSDYTLCYYTSAHPWSQIDTFFVKESDNVHTLSFTADSDENISFNVYNIVTGIYNCVVDSTPVTINEDTDFSDTFELASSSSRGKSLTIYGIKTGMIIDFTYNSDTKYLKISYNKLM